MVHSSRSIFTHMINIKDFEDVAGSYMSHPFREGTLHHIFKRGWFWVIPFNNWEGAPNPLVSIGLTLDDRVYPEDPKLSPEDEFEKFLNMLPSAARQFEDAQTIRPWVRTQRIQYTSSRTMGKRWALLSHAAGFCDPLFSRGLINTMENIRELTETLLPALADGDFSEARFSEVDRQQKLAFSFADRMVAGGYASWDDFDMWNSWVRLWAIGFHGAESNLGSVLTMGKASKFRPTADPACSRYEAPGYREYFERSYSVMREYDEGNCTIAEAKKRLRDALDRFEFVIPLRDRSMGHEWALRNPDCRDVFLGLPANHERWKAGGIDPLLAKRARESGADA
jgi:FADH2 O2-dependent halogenase